MWVEVLEPREGLVVCWESFVPRIWDTVDGGTEVLVEVVVDVNVCDGDATGAIGNDVAFVGWLYEVEVCDVGGAEE